jgi:ABC-type antimicrobial peptide transport system permease subunit
MQESVKRTSLWLDAWRRLLKNKLAVVGLCMLVFMVLLVIFGPPVWYAISGNTPDFMPSDVDNGDLLKSFPPSWSHPDEFR